MDNRGLGLFTIHGEPEPRNDFCDVGILSQSQFSSSSPRTTARGIRYEGALEFHSIMEYDWRRRNKSHYVTEIVFWLGFADVIFGGDKRQPEIRLRSQANERVAEVKFVEYFVFSRFSRFDKTRTCSDEFQPPSHLHVRFS